jgi:hypothetical protein
MKLVAPHPGPLPRAEREKIKSAKHFADASAKCFVEQIFSTLSGEFASYLIVVTVSRQLIAREEFE